MPLPPERSVLIVDDHPLMRVALGHIIKKEPTLTLCGEAEDEVGALALVEQLRPKLVLLDLYLRRGHGLGLVKQIRAISPATLVLIISRNVDAAMAARALRAGANGYVVKEESGEEILNAIRRTLNGGRYVSQSLASEVLERVLSRDEKPDEDEMALLSDREFQVFEMLAGGKSVREIAGELNLSHKTIDSYRECIKTKLNLKDAKQLLLYAGKWSHGQGANPDRRADPK